MSKTGDELKLMAELSMLFIGTSEVLNDLMNLRGTTISSPLLGNAAAFVCDKPEDEEYIKHLSEFQHDFAEKTLDLLQYISDHSIQD